MKTKWIKGMFFFFIFLGMILPGLFIFYTAGVNISMSAFRKFFFLTYFSVFPLIGTLHFWLEE